MYNPCQKCGVCPQPPDDREWFISDGVFIKQMYLEIAGMMVPQHSHEFDHTSMLAVGSVRVWENDKIMGDFKAPHPLFIKAGVKHRFLSLEDNTVIYCIHNVARSGEVQIKEQHQLEIMEVA